MLESGVIKQAALIYGQIMGPPGARARVALTGLAAAEFSVMSKVRTFFCLLIIFSVLRKLVLKSPLCWDVCLRRSVINRHWLQTWRIAGTYYLNNKRPITAVQRVYVPADDLTDPAPATTFAHLDGTSRFVTPDRRTRIYPAVDPLDSTSRILIRTSWEKNIIKVARQVQVTLQKYKDLQDILAIFGYR